jgi:hypothetical protein
MFTNDSNLFRVNYQFPYSPKFEADSDEKHFLQSTPDLKELKDLSVKTESDDTKESSKFDIKFNPEVSQEIKEHKDQKLMGRKRNRRTRKNSVSDLGNESDSDNDGNSNLFSNSFEMLSNKLKNNSKKTKEKKASKDFERYDEAFKGLKSSIYSSLVSNPIKANENKRKGWEVKKNILKNFRALFTVDVKKGNNEACYHWSTIEIITQIYQETIPKLIEELEKEITELESGKSIKEIKPRKSSKKDDTSKLIQANKDLLNYYNESLNLVKIDTFNWEANFSSGSLEILMKTYEQNIEDYKGSIHYHDYLEKLEKYQTDEYIQNFKNILNKFLEYLRFKKLTKEFSKM